MKERGLLFLLTTIKEISLLPTASLDRSLLNVQILDRKLVFFVSYKDEARNECYTLYIASN